MVKVHDKKLADIGFYINLDRRIDRDYQLKKNLQEIGMTGVSRWKAEEDPESPHRALFNTTLNIYRHFLQTENETLLVLEDDCEFLPIFINNYKSILEDIQQSTWDLFWLGCMHRRAPIAVENNCYQVSSVGYAQSYIIRREIAQEIVDFYTGKDWTKFNTGVDEMLTLFAYGKQIASNPWELKFYESKQPLEDFKTVYRSLCHYHCLTTQYVSYSDLWYTIKDWGFKIKATHPSVRDWTIE